MVAETEDSAQVFNAEQMARQDDIRHIADVVARTSGGNLDFKILFGPKGTGSHWSPEKREYVFDSDILDYPLDEALGVIQHEANHEIISSLDYVMDLWPELGFSFGLNAVEDPRANHGGMGIMPGTRPWIQAYIERDLSPGGGLDYKGIKADSEERLGYVPKFMQAGAEFIRYWHDREFTERFADPADFDNQWQQFLSEIPDEDVRAFIDKARGHFEEYFQTVPSSRDQQERAAKAKESSDNFRNNIWPEYRNLVDQSLKDQAMANMVNDMMNGQPQQGGQGQPMIIPFDQLPPEIQDEIREAVKKHQEKQKQKQQQGQQQGEEQGEQEQESGEQGQGEGEEQESQEGDQSGQGQQEGEQGQQSQNQGQEQDSQAGQGASQGEMQGQKSGQQGQEQSQPGEGDTQVPWDQLSDKAKQAIEQVFDDQQQMSDEERQQYMDQAQKDLQDAEDAANEKLSGEMGKPADAKSHQERRDDEAQKAREDTEAESEENQPPPMTPQERAEAEQRWKEAQDKVKRMKSAEQIIKPNKNPYFEFRYQPDVVHTIERWKRELRPLFEPAANPERRFRSTGHRPDIRRAMKHEADSRFDKIFEAKGRPLSNDIRLTILVDLSGSMHGSIDETFKALVSLSEVASHFKIELEIAGFTDTFPGDIRIYKPFEALKLTDAEREKIGAMYADCINQGGGTPTLEATAAEYARIRKRNQRKPMTHNFFVTLTDGQPTSSSQEQLRQVISTIAKDGTVVPVGLGIGYGTEFVNQAYPQLPLAVRTELARKQGRSPDEVGGSFETLRQFTDGFITIVKSMIQHPNQFGTIT